MPQGHDQTKERFLFFHFFFQDSSCSRRNPAKSELATMVAWCRNWAFMPTCIYHNSRFWGEKSENFMYENVGKFGVENPLKIELQLPQLEILGKKGQK